MDGELFIDVVLCAVYIALGVGLVAVRSRSYTEHTSR